MCDGLGGFINDCTPLLLCLFGITTFSIPTYHLKSYLQCYRSTFLMLYIHNLIIINQMSFTLFLMCMTFSTILFLFLKLFSKKIVDNLVKHPLYACKRSQSWLYFWGPFLWKNTYFKNFSFSSHWILCLISRKFHVLLWYRKNVIFICIKESVLLNKILQKAVFINFNFMKGLFVRK